MQKTALIVHAALLASLVAVTSGWSAELLQFQCMGLAHVWSGEGPMPPPVPEYAAPSPGAPVIGTAMATVVVDKPIREQNGRIRVVRPNGKTAWINRQDLTTWHVVSNPKARCWVVQSAKGMIIPDSR